MIYNSFCDIQQANAFSKYSVKTLDYSTECFKNSNKAIFIADIIDAIRNLSNIYDGKNQTIITA